MTTTKTKTPAKKTAEQRAEIARKSAATKAAAAKTVTALAAARKATTKTAKPDHAARVANGEIRLGKDATAPTDATRANVGQTRAKAPKASKPKPDTARKPSGLDLAAKVLTEAREPLSAKAIADRAIAAGWQTSGKTPGATLSAAMDREIKAKGDAARFTKAERGRYTARA